MSEPKYQLCVGDLPLDFPRILPQDAIVDYTISKIVAKQPQYNCSTWEVSRDCAKIHLFDAKHYLRIRNQVLKKCRHTAVMRRNIFDAKWKDLAIKEEAFKMMFKRFNKFVRENHEKRERAEKKIADEIELQQKRSLDIELMHEHYNQVSSIKNMMERRIKEHRMYEDYLQTVVKTSQNHKNLNELLYRYESLIETKNILSEKQQSSLISLELARANMMKLIEEKTLILVGLQNQLASLEERYNLAYAKSLQWESNVSKIQDISNYECTLAHMVKCSIDDTYAAMCRRKNIEPKTAADDYQSKLAFINKTLGELPRVLTRMKILRRTRRLH